MIDREVLQALLKNIVLDVSTAEQAAASASALASLLPGTEYHVSSQFDERTESHRIVVLKQFHGNMLVSHTDQNFVEGGDYAQLRRTGLVLHELFGKGAFVQRGDQKQAISEFKQALDWLLNQVKQGLSIQSLQRLGRNESGTTVGNDYGS